MNGWPKGKPRFMSELAYVLALPLLALGAALMERADFGMSMVVAPAYLLHLKLCSLHPFFTFGALEYLVQGALLLVLCLVLRQFRPAYLFSFVTAVLYGFVLDGCMALAALLPAEAIVLRLLWYVLGMLLCSAGVSLMFHTYLAPEVYELFVKELSAKFRLRITRVKTVYDIASALVGVLLSFLFFGLWHFEGVKLGTVVCALVNGFLIGQCSKLLDRTFVFYDRFPFRSRFETASPLPIDRSKEETE